jgi:hypothetical protein
MDLQLQLAERRTAQLVIAPCAGCIAFELTVRGWRVTLLHSIGPARQVGFHRIVIRMCQYLSVSKLHVSTFDGPCTAGELS